MLIHKPLFMSTLILILCSLGIVATAQQTALSKKDDRYWDLEEKLTPILKYWNQEKYDKALKLCDQIIKEAPNFTLAYVRKAYTYWYMKDTDAYEALFTKILQFTPQSAELYMNYAGMYEDSKNYQAAYEIYTQAIDSIPNNPELFRLRARVSYKLDKGDLAIKDYNQAIHLAPQDSSLYALRGWRYVVMGEPDKAFSDFDKAISIAPKYHRYYYGRAAVQERNYKDYRGALVDYTKAYRLAEGEDKKEYLECINNCKYSIGVGYQMQGLDAFLALDYAQAIRYYKESLKWGLDKEDTQKSNKYIKLAQQFLAKRQQQVNAEKNKEKVARNALKKGNTLFGQKNYREALPHLEKAAVKMDLYLEPAQAVEAYELYQDCKLEVARLEKAAKKD